VSFSLLTIFLFLFTSNSLHYFFLVAGGYWRVHSGGSSPALMTNHVSQCTCRVTSFCTGVHGTDVRRDPDHDVGADSGCALPLLRRSRDGCVTCVQVTLASPTRKIQTASRSSHRKCCAAAQEVASRDFSPRQLSTPHSRNAGAPHACNRRRDAVNSRIGYAN
jgi:hypothetical protein